MTWQFKTFEQLTTTELYAIMQQRVQVFVVEQTCPYPELDGNDAQALHLWQASDKGEVNAYARIFLASDEHAYNRIGRVLTSAHTRRSGLGRTLMKKAIQICAEKSPGFPIRLGAQVYLIEFYRSFGFVEIGDEYLEDDIPHIDMERPA